MCGRKTLTADMQTIVERFAIEEWENPDSYFPSYNIAPAQKSPILIDKGKRIIHPMQWGLIPAWAKDNKFASKMINARIETLMEKPSFNRLMETNRCIVISDGYYEWKNTKTNKIPYYIRSCSNEFLPMAGLYDVWKNPEGKIIPTYTIVTKSSQDDIAEIYGRMPVILPQDHLDIWLKTNKHSIDNALELAYDIKPLLAKYPVSSFVNSVKNNSEKCIEKMDTI